MRHATTHKAIERALARQRDVRWTTREQRKTSRRLRQKKTSWIIHKLYRMMWYRRAPQSCLLLFTAHLTLHTSPSPARTPALLFAAAPFTLPPTPLFFSRPCRSARSWVRPPCSFFFFKRIGPPRSFPFFPYTPLFR